MAIGLKSWVDRLRHRRMLRAFDRSAQQVARTDLANLPGLRNRTRQIRRRIDRVLFLAEERLAMSAGTGDTNPRPLHCDWAWRPQLWRGPVHPAGSADVPSRSRLGDELTVFHDCRTPEIVIRQIRNVAAVGSAPYGVTLDVFRFDGTFLSLVVDLPDDVTVGLKRRHLLGLVASIEVEKKVEVFARLNVRHGPNTDQIVRELPADNGERAVDFDLAYSGLNEKRVDKLWMDLIFEGPEMNQILIRDLILTRRPRAEL